MASDTSSNANANPVQADMDDILSSIRSGVVEEGSKVGTGSADLIEAADVDNGSEDDVLELSETDMVTAEPDLGGANGEELIDLDAFGASGEAKALTGTAAVANELLTAESVQPAVVGDAADEFDRLLAEISQEQQQQVVASKISKEELLAEEVPLGAEEPVAVGDSAVDTLEEAAEKMVDGSVADAAALDMSAGLVEPVVQAATATMGAARFELGAVQGPEGVQIAFPAEVLAMALRPMVQEWLSKNLPEVVEKLVKEEISKLAQN